MLSTIFSSAASFSTWISKVVRLAIVFRSTYEELKNIKAKLEKEIQDLKKIQNFDKERISNRESIIEQLDMVCDQLGTDLSTSKTKHAAASKIIGQLKGELNKQAAALQEIAEAAEGKSASGTARMMARKAKEALAAAQGAQA